MPWLSIGAVTMKMISSTSMTSMYGTTLISPISRRPRPRVTGDMVQPCAPAWRCRMVENSSMNAS